MFKIKALKGTTVALVLSGIIAFSTPSHGILGDQVLRTGMNHEDIQVLQQELKNLGHFNEENTTTYYGPVTELAVMEFQRANDLEINGIFDLTTFEALKALMEEKSEEEETNIINLIFNREISFQSKGEDVRLLQDALKALEYLVIDSTTDYFGTMTKEALIAFQTDHELRPDGIAGLRTIESLNSVLTGRKITLPGANRGANLSTIAENIVATARKFLGYRYVYGGSSPNGFDCSGFTSYVYKQFGITLPRSSVGQASAGVQISKADLLPGDLLIFSNTYKKGPSHTGVYIGNGKFIHSSTSTTGVITSDLNSTHYTKHFSYGRRLY